MNCTHPDAAIPDPKRDELDWDAQNNHPFYLARCHDCGDRVEVHLTGRDVRPL